MSIRDDILAGLRIAEPGSVGDETPEELLGRYRAEVEREIRWQVAEDFRRLSETRTTDISWGEAFDIARDGLCSCNGGTQPCPVDGGRR